MMNANNNFEMMELNDQDLEKITGGKGCFGNHGSFLYRLLFDDKNKNKKSKTDEFESFEYDDEYEYEY